jgi:hypothetical protein
MDRDALQDASARAVAKAVAQMFPRHADPDEQRIATERAYAKIKAAFENYESFTARRT